jgi:hypothetical protein
MFNQILEFGLTKEISKMYCTYLDFKIHNIMKQFDKVNRREIIINVVNVFWSTNWKKLQNEA